MAKENIVKFFETTMTDKALAEKLAALAAENEYAFTAEELLSAYNGQIDEDIHGGYSTCKPDTDKADQARILSDDEAEAATGGVSSYRHRH